MTSLAEYRALFDLNERSAMVIGAGSGIGEACAQALAAHGAHVVCADVGADAAERVTQGIVAQHGHATTAVVDITDVASVDELFAANPNVEVVVCTPSINVRKPIMKMTEDEFARVMNLNLGGTFNVVKAAGATMTPNGKGSIVVFSSVRSQVVEPGQGAYAATKAGAAALVKTAAAEFGPMGVRVNAVAPGVVETPLTEQIKADKEWYQAYADISALGRWSSPAEQTGAVVYLASDAASFVTGTILFVDGGWIAVDGRFTPPL